MNLRFSTLPHLFAALCAVAMALPAQEEGDPDLQKLEDLRREREAGKEGETERSLREKEEWANLTPEQRLERGKRRGAQSHCTFVADMRPAKLMPGTSGKLVVAALLKGNAVLPSPARVQFVRPTSDAPLEYGPMSALPAELGVTAKAYLGQPVYENYAWFEIPVTMKSDATLGDTHRVAIDLEFDLYDGGSAQALGRFLEQVTTSVVVGMAADPQVVGADAARPEPQGRSVEAASEVPTPVRGAEPAEMQPPAIDATEAPASVPPPAQPDVAPAPTGSTSSGPLPSGGTEQGGAPVVLLVGGGVFGLLILLLIVRRK